MPCYDTTQTTLASFPYHYDLVGNPKEIEDLAPSGQYVEPAWPQRLRTMGYDDLYRVTSVAYGYDTPNGMAVAESPFLAEETAGDRTPAPRRFVGERVRSETFSYDHLGNIISNTDDQNAAYDRSLGTAISYGNGTGMITNGANQLTAASGVQVRYDGAGNLEELKVERPYVLATPRREVVAVRVLGAGVD